MARTGRLLTMAVRLPSFTGIIAPHLHNWPGVVLVGYGCLIGAAYVNLGWRFAAYAAMLFTILIRRMVGRIAARDLSPMSQMGEHEIPFFCPHVKEARHRVSKASSLQQEQGKYPLLHQVNNATPKRRC